VFRPVLESSRPPSVYIRSLHGGRGVGCRVGSWRGCLMRSFLWWCHILSRSNEVDGLASPPPLHRPTTYSRLLGGGDRTSPRGATWSCCGSAYREEEASRGIVIGWWLCPLLVLVPEISQDKWILTRWYLSLGKVMMLLGVLPR
jgi:hypothetical protein